MTCQLIRVPFKFYGHKISYPCKSKYNYNDIINHSILEEIHYQVPIAKLSIYNSFHIICFNQTSDSTRMTNYFMYFILNAKR